MRRIHPLTLLFILLGAVPVAVGVAGLASFLLLRAGYEFLVWALLPLLALLLIAGCLGVVLGMAAGGTRQGAGRRKEERTRGERPREEPSRRGDGV